MGKAFGLILMLIAMYVALTLYTKGVENSFNGAFAPITPIGEQEDANTDQGDWLDPMDPDPGRRAAPERVPITEYVRDRVTRQVQEGAERRQRAVGQY